MNRTPKLRRITTLATLLATLGCATTSNLHNTTSIIEPSSDKTRVEYEIKGSEETTQTRKPNIQVNQIGDTPLQQSNTDLGSILENSNAGKPEANDITPPKRATSKNKDYGNILFYYLEFLPSVPGTALHESVHALPMLILGVGVDKIRIWPDTIYTLDRENNITQRVVAGYVVPSREMTKTEKAIVNIAPYAFDLLVEHRAIASAYKRNDLGRGIFPVLVNGILLGHAYSNIATLVSSTEEDADIGEFSKSIGVNEWTVTNILWTMYGYSFIKIAKSMEFDEFFRGAYTVPLLHFGIPVVGKGIGELIDLIKK